MRQEIVNDRVLSLNNTLSRVGKSEDEEGNVIITDAAAAQQAERDFSSGVSDVADDMKNLSPLELSQHVSYTPNIKNINDNRGIKSVTADEEVAAAQDDDDALPAAVAEV